MKIWCQRFSLAILLSFASPAKASEASDEYVSIYSLITKGDEMLGSGLRAEAAQFYSDAHRKLVAFRSAYPDWNHQVVRFRLKYLGEKLADLPEIEVTTVSSSATNASTGGQSSAGRGNDSGNRLLEGQIAALNEQMRQLTADNSLLLSKLRESMSARPAEVDPSQVRKAEKKILELEKENDLIETQLRKALKTPVAPRQSEVSRAALKEAQAAADRLRSSNARLQKDVSEITRQLDQSRTELAELGQKVERITSERDQLKKKASQAAPTENRDRDRITQLSRENDDLKSRLTATETQFAAFRKKADMSRELEKLTRERDSLRRQLQASSSSADNRDELEKLMRENALLERQLADTRGEVTTKSVTDEKIQKRLETLEKQNRDLTNQLSKTRKSGDRGGWLPRLGRRGSKDLSVMEARLAVLEAEKEPYTTEELALLQGGDLSDLTGSEPASAASVESNTVEISQAAAALESEAQAFARAGDFARAETKYDEILDLIPNHAPSLASLALTQLKQDKLGEAEANLEMALKIAPENTYALFLSGLLNMSQQKFDKAVTFLSRATVLDPDDAEAHNHLGIALTEVGHRGPAEAALRKAIRLRPGYGEAHVNLAVVYASQKPPFKELAKYHYQQALNAGHPADPRIEQLLKTD